MANASLTGDGTEGGGVRSRILMLFSIAVVIIDLTDYYFSTDNFCAHTCHVMERTVFKEI